MADGMRKLLPGEKLQRFSKDAYNAFVDAAEWVRQQQQSGGAPLLRQTRQPAIVTVRNASNADVDRFGVLELGDPVIEPADNEDEFLNRVAVDGVLPVATGAAFCLTLEPIPAGEIGRGVVLGVMQAKIDVQDEADTAVSPVAGETGYLATGGAGGARLLWVAPEEEADGDGLRLGLVLLNGSGFGGLDTIFHVMPPDVYDHEMTGALNTAEYTDFSRIYLDTISGLRLRTAAGVLPRTAGIFIEYAGLTNCGVVSTNEQYFGGAKHVTVAREGPDGVRLEITEADPSMTGHTALIYPGSGIGASSGYAPAIQTLVFAVHQRSDGPASAFGTELILFSDGRLKLHTTDGVSDPRYCIGNLLGLDGTVAGATFTGGILTGLGTTGLYAGPTGPLMWAGYQ